jgi:RNA polymerase sigma-70 factor (ECF subfamily)
MTFAHAVPVDSDLLARIRAGDEAAYEQLFRRYYQELCLYAARIDPTPGSAEDIVQEILLRLWVRHEELPDVQSLPAYLFTAVRNQALNQRARAASAERWRQAKQVELHDAPVSAPTADELVQAAELASAIERAISELPPRCREAFVLRRQRGLPCAEIARIMGITTKTVEIQIGNALKLIRKSLADWI